MNRATITAEINRDAAPEDRALLLRYLAACTMRSQWSALVHCAWIRYGTQSYEARRVWAPTNTLRAMDTQPALPANLSLPKA